MAYKGFISEGEDYVGQLSAVRRKMLATTASSEIIYNFEDEEELFACERGMQIEKSAEARLLSQRKSYMAFWGYRKAVEALNHEKHCKYTCDRCGLCRASHAVQFYCLCGEGKKFMSPYRVVFLNSIIREDWRTKIYHVGYGWEVKNPPSETQPDWRRMNWS